MKVHGKRTESRGSVAPLEGAVCSRPKIDILRRCSDRVQPEGPHQAPVVQVDVQAGLKADVGTRADAKK